MIEQGLVLDVRNGRAKVEMAAKGGSCCGGCTFCSLEGNSRTLEMDAPDDLRPGDRVRVQVPVRSAVTATLALFVVPLLLLMGGLAAGAHFFPAEGVVGQVNLPALLLGAVLAALWYGGVALVERRRRRRSDATPRIVEVVRARTASPPDAP